MGPGDPYAARAQAPADSREDAAPEAEAAGGVNGPLRIQARVPDPPPTARVQIRNAAFIGAAIGLGVALLFVMLSPGQAVLVLALTLIGAALGVIARNLFHAGIDVGAAWHALRRR